MSSRAPRLLVVAHGTASRRGSATTARLVDAVRSLRPSAEVQLCFLDVAFPRLPHSLAALDGAPTVLVPLLLSTGYHVQTDIPAAVAAYPNVAVARHLGPHPRLVDALVERLGPVAQEGTTMLVGAGSSRAEAAAELAETASMLAARLNRPVAVATMGDDVAAAVRALPEPVQVATYLLAEGQFVTALGDALAGRGSVAAPIGVHPAVAELVWERYDAAVGTR